MSWSEMSVQEFAALRQQGVQHTLIDVREDWELSEACLADFVHIRMNDFPENVDQMREMVRPLVLVCHAGIRSAHCAAWLAEQGIHDVYSLRGGVHAWASEIDASIGFY
jgi:rhodanese-related sulfurtransferase